MTITPQRAWAIAFSRPYFQAGQAIVVRDSGHQIQTLDQPLALQGLANGNADVVVSDVPAILYAIDQAKFAGLCISGEYLCTECYDIALPLRSPILPALLQSMAVPFTINRLVAAVTALSLNVAAYLG